MIQRKQTKDVIDYPIDFVITWVDGNDPLWQQEKSLYSETIKTGDQSETRFRDWDTLQYWFRGIEKYAPWVNKIHFVTWGHLPSWLNTDHPKLNVVNHKDYIPEKYLPTFNSHTIELNIHRIKNLSEHFVYFNDDIFMINKTHPTDFFKKGFPCDTFALNCIYFGYDSVGSIHGADIEIINSIFNKRKLQKKLLVKWISPKNGIRNVIRTGLLLPWPWFPGFYYQHLMNSYCKSTLEEVWEQKYDILDQTCLCRFREKTNVNQWVFKFWQLASGAFYPRNPNIGRCFHLKEGNYMGACSQIKESNYKLLCLNDTAKTTNFEEMRDAIIQAFTERFPQKSMFEK